MWPTVGSEHISLNHQRESGGLLTLKPVQGQLKLLLGSYRLFPVPSHVGARILRLLFAIICWTAAGEDRLQAHEVLPPGTPSRV